MSGMARRFGNVPDLQRHAVRVPCEPQVFDLLSTAADDPLGFGFTPPMSAASAQRGAGSWKDDSMDRGVDMQRRTGRAQTAALCAFAAFVPLSPLALGALFAALGI